MIFSVVISNFIKSRYVQLGYSVAVSAYVLFLTFARDPILTTFVAFCNLAFPSDSLSLFSPSHFPEPCTTTADLKEPSKSLISGVDCHCSVFFYWCERQPHRAGGTYLPCLPMLKRLVIINHDAYTSPRSLSIVYGVRGRTVFIGCSLHPDCIFFQHYLPCIRQMRELRLDIGAHWVSNFRVGCLII